jgi:cytochrome c-type biogenesis protein CcmH
MMNILWSLLVVLVGLAMVFIWWPWLRKPNPQQGAGVAVDRDGLNVDLFKQRVAELQQELDQDNLDQVTFDQLTQELEQNLLQEVDEQPALAAKDTAAQERSVWVPLGMTLLVPLLSFYLYSQWGSSDLLAMPRQQASAAHPDTGHDLQGIGTQVAALRARLEAEPGDSQGWFTLGRSYLTLERYEDAYRAFGKVAELVGEHAEIISQQAQALYFLNNRQITAEVQQMIDRALELDAGDPNTLGLLGMSAFESGQFEKAIGYWQQLIGSDRPNVNRDGLRQAIAQAKTQLEQRGIVYQPASAVADNAAAATAVSLKVLVELDPALKNSMAPETTVFISAQALQGPKMPLAAVRLQLRDLPAMVTLDDTMAMTPMAKLSSVDQVQVRATVSLSGTPGAKPGDILGVASPVQVAGNDALIKILINEVVK